MQEICGNQFFFSLFDIFQTMVKYRRDNCLTHKVVFTLMLLKW